MVGKVAGNQDIRAVMPLHFKESTNIIGLEC